MNKYIGKFIGYASGVISVFVFSFVVGLNCFAQDADLADVYSTSTAMVQNEKEPIMTFLVGLTLVVLVIGLAKVALWKAKTWITKSFAG